MEVGAAEIERERHSYHSLLPSSRSCFLQIPNPMQHVMFQRRLPTRHAASAVSKILSRLSGHRNVSRAVPEGSVGTSRISPSEPTTLSEDGIRTLRIRKHGHKPLPIPEIMDPIYLYARNKHKQPRQVIIGYRRLDVGQGRHQDRGRASSQSFRN